MDGFIGWVIILLKLGTLSLSLSIFISISVLFRHWTQRGLYFGVYSQYFGQLHFLEELLGWLSWT